MEKPLTHLYVVSDTHGFVGVYSSLEAAQGLARAHAPVPFLIHRYAAEPGGSQEEAWMIIYEANEAVAFASNCKETARAVQKKYLTVGLVYDEDVGYWQHPLNVLSKN